MFKRRPAPKRVNRETIPKTVSGGPSAYVSATENMFFKVETLQASINETINSAASLEMVDKQTAYWLAEQQLRSIPPQAVVSESENSVRFCNR